jgi:hypothetical protein
VEWGFASVSGRHQSPTGGCSPGATPWASKAAVRDPNEEVRYRSGSALDVRVGGAFGRGFRGSLIPAVPVPPGFGRPSWASKAARCCSAKRSMIDRRADDVSDCGLTRRLLRKRMPEAYEPCSGCRLCSPAPAPAPAPVRVDVPILRLAAGIVVPTGAVGRS